jgi:hypothetical protein
MSNEDNLLVANMQSTQVHVTNIQHDGVEGRRSGVRDEELQSICFQSAQAEVAGRYAYRKREKIMMNIELCSLNIVMPAISFIFMKVLQGRT